MSKYEFTCPVCSQQIEVDEPMREAILEHGCPVCTSDVDRTNFGSVPTTG